MSTGWRGNGLLIMLMAAVTLGAMGVSCSDGVSDAELITVVNDLELEKTRSQALDSELAVAKAETARLVEAVDRFEMRIAELESVLAKEQATTAGTQLRVDEAEFEAALLAVFLAWNRKDREGFTGSFTNNGIAETLLSIPTNLGEPAIALRRVMDTAVTDDTATIHAMFALGTQRHSVRYSMAKQDGVWRIADEERLSPKVHGDTPVVDLRLDGCSALSESERVVGRSVAFVVEHSGPQHANLVLKRVAEDLDLSLLLEGNVASPEDTRDVAFVREAKSGESINVAFTEPLQPGRYVLLCYTQDPSGTNEVRPAAEEILAAFRVK